VGIAIGQLIGADTTSYTALQLLDLTLAPLGIPVITGLPIGHDTTQAMPIVLGTMAEIDVQNSQLKVNVPSV
jgi:muramoyltetrapeptide carboxypeptidase LdcA involved in peptidoglycan recycling